VPWLTGAGVFEAYLLGVRLPDGGEAYAWVDGTDRDAFRFSEPLALAACASTRTVTVRVDGLPLDEGEFTRREPAGALARGDAMGVLFQTPLMIGNLRASLRLIEDSPQVEESMRRRCRAAVDSLIGEVFDALEVGTAERGRGLRARVGDMTARLGRLAVMACGGKALALTHPAQRVYREALLFSLMAQTERIVNEAFGAVFGETFGEGFG
jgi:hypothetical protein